MKNLPGASNNQHTKSTSKNDRKEWKRHQTNEKSIF
jgi:hypothetical protein